MGAAHGFHEGGEEQQPGASPSVWQTIPDDAWANQPADDDRDDLGGRNQSGKKKSTRKWTEEGEFTKRDAKDKQNGPELIFNELKGDASAKDADRNLIDFEKQLTEYKESNEYRLPYTGTQVDDAMYINQ